MKRILNACLGILFLFVTCAAMAAPKRIGSRAMVNGLRVEQRINARANSHFLRQDETTRIGSLTTPLMKAETPVRVTAGGSNIYGNLWSTTATPVTYGLYGLTSTGSELRWADPVIRQIGLPMQCGWLIDGKLCGYYVVTDYGTLAEFYYVEIDFETGYEVSTTPLSTENGYFLCADYNTDDGNIYGYGLSKNYLFAFMKAPVTDPGNITIIKEFDTNEDCLSFTYNRYDQKFYGVNGEGIFVSVDTRGKQTAICSLEDLHAETLYCGLCYAPKEGIFYWNPQFGDGSSAIYTLDPANATMTRVMTCPNSEQYVFFVSPDRRVTPLTPENPTITAVHNAEGTLSPTVELTMPTTLVDGGELTGPLTWNAMIDGEKVMSGESAPGEIVEIRFSGLEEGMHLFTFYATNAGADSDFVSESFFVGIDTPKAPADVTLSNTSVEWTAVTDGVHGGYVDLSDMEYEVFLLDMRQENPTPLSIGTTKATSIDIPASIAGQLKRTVANVVASSRGKTSLPGSSNELGLGAALKLDVYFEPTPEDFEAMTVIDANGDGRTWSYSIFQECIKSSFTSPGKGKMDDWLILPAIEFPSATDSYIFSVDVQTCNSSSPDEYLEVLIGTAPDVASMSSVLIPTFRPTRTIDTYTATFNLPDAGNYYIALHTTSDEFQEGVLVSKIRVSRSTLTGNGPSEVTDIEATPAPAGELQATVGFNLPATTHYGAPLDPATTVIAAVRCLNTVEVSGAPGERVYATVATSQGENTVTIVPRIGDETGMESTVDVFTGVDIPSYVTNLQTQISDDMLSMTITWDEPYTGIHGGYIETSSVTYEAYRYNATFLGASWERIEDLGFNTSFTYSVPAGSQQGEYIIGIVASTIAGKSDLVATAYGILGSPYPLPMIEDFDTEDEEGSVELEYSPWIIYAPDDTYKASWNIVKMSELFDGGYEGNALVGIPSVADDRGRIGLPAFATKDAIRPQVVVTLYTGSVAADLTILAETYDSDEMIEVGNVWASAEEVAPVRFTLPLSLCGKEWVKLYLEPHYPTANHLCIIDAIGVLDNPLGSLSAAEADSGSVRGGIGEVIVEGFEGTAVRVYAADGRLVATAAPAGAALHLPATPGIYLVSAGSVNTKVTVR